MESEPSERSGSASAERGGVAPWLEGLALAALALLILTIGGEAVRTSYHGYRHATLGEAVLRDGLLPENPYHAGTPLRYYTLYPAAGVLLGRLGFGPLWAFALLNGLAALLLAPALDALGRALRLTFPARRATFLAMVLGLNALGWIGFVAGDPPEFGELPKRVFHSMTFLFTDLGWDARLQGFLPKFLNVSSYALALPFGLWALAETTRAGGRPWRGAVFGGLALAINPLVGAFAGAGMVVWLLPVWRHGSARSRLLWLAAGAGAVVVSLPFLWALFNPAPTGVELHPIGEMLGHPVANLVGPLIVLALPGLAGLRRMDLAARWRLMWVAGLAFLAVLLLRLPRGNEYKLARMGGILWSLPVGVWAAAWWRAGGVRRLAPLALAVFALPNLLLIVYSYLEWGRESGATPLHADSGRLVADTEQIDVPLTIFRQEREAPADAVILMDPFGMKDQLDPNIQWLTQGNPLTPVFRHPLVVDMPQLFNNGLEDLTDRLNWTNVLWTGMDWEGNRSMSQEEALASLRQLLPNRPFLVLHYRRTIETPQVLRDAGGEDLARGKGFSLWSFPAWNVEHGE